jgi:hypothetical protein
VAEKTALQEYQDEDYQPIYFVADSFNSAKEQLRYSFAYFFIKFFL